MSNPPPDRLAITQLVRALGSARGALPITLRQIEDLRDFFGRQVLRTYVDSYILAKFYDHVEEDRQWPEDTTPEEFLECLRSTVLDQRSAIYLTDARSLGEWSIYFVGRVRRAWKGPGGSGRIVIIFNADQPRFVTGFQPEDGDAYVYRQDGFRLWPP